MKPSSRLPAIILTAWCAIAASIPLNAQEASAYRRFSTRDGKPFYAIVVEKTATSVTLKLQDGRKVTRTLRELADPDQNFIRKWTKFKDDLLNNAEFSKLTVKEMLELRGYQSFEFDIEGNHIFVEGQVNGKQMRFMVDTGADSSLIHSGSAEEAALQMGPYDVEIRGVGGKAMAAVTIVPNIKLGDAVIEKRKLLATDLFQKGKFPKDYDVIFGADFLRELDAVISYREGRMFLKPDNINRPDKVKPAAPGEAKAEFRRWTMEDGKTFSAALHDKNAAEAKAIFRFQDGRMAPLELAKLNETDRHMIEGWSKLRDDLSQKPEFRTLTVKELLELRNYQSLDYRLSGNHILIDGTIKATKSRFLIDTGAHGCVLHLAYAKKAGLEVGPMDQVIFGIGGQAPAALAMVPVMQIGDAIIENRQVLCADLFKDSGALEGQGDHDALFGADFLRELDTVISYKENRMFLRPDISDKQGGKASPKPENPSTPPGESPEKGDPK
jgi:predicted aspartyl protease